tara:strand:- start:3071 stop:3589 length:519 start_codon:yes stop_codon:yes gene_type:complete
MKNNKINRARRIKAKAAKHAKRAGHVVFKDENGHINIGSLPPTESIKFIKADIQHRSKNGESKHFIDECLAYSIAANIRQHCFTRKITSPKWNDIQKMHLMLQLAEEDRGINLSDHLKEEDMGLIMLFKLNAPTLPQAQEYDDRMEAHWSEITDGGPDPRDVIREQLQYASA